MGYFKNILVHVDKRDEGHDELACAAALARQHQAKLKLVDILPAASWPTKLFGGNTEQWLDSLMDAKQQRLRELAAEHQGDGLELTWRVLPGPTSIALIREAVESQHDLVVKATKGSQSRRSGFFGTTAIRLLRKCPVPVLLVKPEFPGQFDRIVAAVDATSDHEHVVRLNEDILQTAAAICPQENPPQVIHAWSLYGASILKEHMPAEEFEEALQKTETHARQSLNELLVRSHRQADDPAAHLLQGDPIDIIPEFVARQESDLLVMGTVGRSGISGLLMGNTAEQILERVSCSVLALKPPGFETPIRWGA